MLRSASLYRRLIVMLCLVLAPLAIGTTSASAAYQIWAAPYGPIYSGGHAWDNTYHGTIYRVDANSTGTAYAGTYVVNSAGTRTSRDDYCNSPGCGAYVNWAGPYPAGFGAAHNHGNANPSWFEAAVYWY